MDFIEEKLAQWRNGEVSDAELLMRTMVYRRRLFEIETDLLNSMKEAETIRADERMKRIGIPPFSAT